jgi:hypothetical protein
MLNADYCIASSLFFVNRLFIISRESLTLSNHEFLVDVCRAHDVYYPFHLFAQEIRIGFTDGSVSLDLLI